MTKSIWCDELEVPAEMKANSRLTYTYIDGRDEEGYTYNMVSSFLATATKEDVKRAVDSLIRQSGDDHHVFIEGFDLTEDGYWEVCLGS